MSDDKRCKCGFAKSIVGDGCRYCNPQEYIDKLIDIIEDQEGLIASLEDALGADQ